MYQLNPRENRDIQSTFGIANRSQADPVELVIRNVASNVLRMLRIALHRMWLLKIEKKNVYQ